MVLQMLNSKQLKRTVVKIIVEKIFNLTILLWTFYKDVKTMVSKIKPNYEKHC